MSAAEHPVGTVATATVRGVSGVRVIATANGKWMVPSRVDGYYIGEPKQVTNVHPLLVIDLPDADTALAVAGTLNESRWYFDQHVGKQIEEQTKPPKPTEPTGLGAVVEDAQGNLHVRTDATYAPWLGGSYVPTVGRNRPWGDIDAVRVLSEGHSP